MKLILDLDTGIDDGMALAYTLGNEEMELLGVKGTYGNVYTKEGVQNVLNILHMFGKENIPVYAGESHAIAKTSFERLDVSARIHGENGVGQVSMTSALRTLEPTRGVTFLIDSIKQYGKELTIIATGPMTNIACALQEAPEISDLLNIVIMGGALTIPGNVTPYTEANIFQDPEGAKLLFESNADITMVGLDVTQRSQLTKADTQQFRLCGSTGGVMYADMIDYYIGQHEHSNGTACYLHDPSAAICAIHPEYFTMLPMYMSVVTQGEARGRTIGNASKLRCDNPNVKVCVGVNAEALETHLKETLLALFKKC